MNADQLLLEVDRTRLTAPVRRALDRADARILEWRHELLGGGFGNPVSLGLFRLSGTARSGGETLPWSLVLKMAQSPANVGETDMGEGDNQGHWNYWRREFYIYQSGLLEDLPQGLAAPRFYGAEEQPDDVFWLWLEDVQDRFRGEWPLGRFALAARHFGRFNGVYLAGWPLPDAPWLCTNLLPFWCANYQPVGDDLQATHARTRFLSHPLSHALFPQQENDPALRAMAGYGAFLKALDSLPRTLCHLDAYPTNLMARRIACGEETVAVDWALAGIAPVGSELVQLVLGALQTTPNPDPAHIDRLLFGAYLDGLRDAGWRGPTADARLGHTLTATLRATLVFLWTLGAWTKDHPADELQERDQRLEELVDQSVPMAAYLRTLATEAFSLLEA